MTLKINGGAVAVPEEITTWCEFIIWLGQKSCAVGQGINRVLVGEREEAVDYRKPIPERNLNSLGLVEIETVDLETIFRNSLPELEQEIRNAIAATSEVTYRFENRKGKEAYQLLDQLLDSMGIFFTIFTEDSGWIEPADAEISQKNVPALLERALNQLLTARENRHWVSVCDILEYEIAPVLESWQTIVEQTRLDATRAPKN